jgi:hypothetical protein
MLAMVEKTCPLDYTIRSDSENSTIGGGLLQNNDL